MLRGLTTGHFTMQNKHGGESHVLELSPCSGAVTVSHGHAIPSARPPNQNLGVILDSAFSFISHIKLSTWSILRSASEIGLKSAPYSNQFDTCHVSPDEYTNLLAGTPASRLPPFYHPPGQRDPSETHTCLPHLPAHLAPVHLRAKRHLI